MAISVIPHYKEVLCLESIGIFLGTVKSPYVLRILTALKRRESTRLGYADG